MKTQNANATALKTPEETAEVMVKLTVELESSAGTMIKKSFTGRWLIDPNEEFEGGDGRSGYRYYAVAETARGGIAVYIVNEESENTLTVHDNFDDFVRNRYPEDVIAEVASHLDVPYEID